jgi:1,4-alpha-glucan branching enzyme
MLKEVPDEQWNVWDIWNIMTDRLHGVKTVAYCESHDQAMVGDKTLAFRLMDAEMYTGMSRGEESVVISRGMALHKMIRLVTIAAGGSAYLNFMGNEFGHPEWIDFPREGNGWSYAHARRQWSLADSPLLRYSWLLAFDGAMIAAVRDYCVLREEYPYRLQMDEGAQTMVFSRSRLVFVFNWHPSVSRPDYAIEVPEPGKYRLLLSTDEARFGGQGRQTSDVSEASGASDTSEAAATEHFSYTLPDGRHFIQIYNICRVAAVYVKVKD